MDLDSVSNLGADELRRLAKDFYWYHQIDLGQGVVTQGDYDMDKYWSDYKFPENLAGKNVLDVGRASGYFSFEFEKRGAQVVATEIDSFFDWDFVGGEAERKRRAAEIADHAAFTERFITGAFNFAHAVRKSTVEKRTTTIYGISPETVGGPFDLVFAGSVTSHLRDPILGLERLRTVTAPDGLCVVSAPFVDIHPDIPAAAMVGTADTDRRSWWVLNKLCLIEMLKMAGFTQIDVVSYFTLQLQRPDTQADAFPHIVAHARP